MTTRYHGVQQQQDFLKIIVSLLAIVGSIKSVQAANYHGYKVYQLEPDTPSKNEYLQQLEGITGFDFWMHPRGNTSKLMVAPELQRNFEDLLNTINVHSKVVIEDVQDFIEGSEPMSQFGGRRSTNSEPFDPNNFQFDRFLRYNEMVIYLKTITKNKKYSKTVSMGKSFEGRDIVGVEIGNTKDVPVIFVDGGIHAREWAAPMTVLYLIKMIVENEEEFADRLQIFIFPCVNPDGYEFTHTKDRLWRKNRSVSVRSTCRGTDANRNFDSHWSEMGTDSNPCAGIYPGPGQFSEPESQAIRDTILFVKPVMYLTFHSYGPLILYPWGFTEKLPDNWMELDTLAHKAAAALKKVYGTEYTIGSSTNVLYAASGGSDDWAMEKAGVPLVYTIELPEHGMGFELPAEKIKPVVTETWEAFLVFADHVHQNYGIGK